MNEHTRKEFGNSDNVTQYINVKGNVPLINYKKFSKGLVVEADFVFIGKFIEEINMSGEKTSVFLAVNWEIVYPYVTNGISCK